MTMKAATISRKQRVLPFTGYQGEPHLALIPANRPNSPNTAGQAKGFAPATQENTL